MKRIAKVAAVGTAGLGLVLGATPANADPAAGVVAFVGSATVSPGLSAPVLGEAQEGTWSLSNAGGLPNAGVGVATTGDAGAAVISASGDLHAGLVAPFGDGALCGLSGGTGGTSVEGGTGSITIGESAVELVTVGWAQSAATVIVFNGTTNTGVVVGAVSAIPPVPGVIGAGSCAAGTATQFTVVGAGAATFDA